MQTLAQMAFGLRSQTLTSVSLTEAALAAAHDPNGQGQRTFIYIDASGARAQAQAADALRRAGTELSPIMGIPISVKDLFDISGQTTRAGSRVLLNAPPAPTDATVVERLRRAGAVIIGRTNMVEFAYSGLGLNPHYGTPLNPWDRAHERIPGGSSSGAAVSVTDNMCAAAIGTDTGGSVRIPAAFCGLTGFKPTACRVDRSGTLPLSQSLDSIGPLAPTVACCAWLDAVLSGTAPTTFSTPDVSDLRLLAPLNVVLDGLEPPVANAFEDALARLSKSGAHIVQARLPEFDEWHHYTMQGDSLAAPEAYAWHRDLLRQQEAGYDPRVARRIRKGAEVSAADYIATITRRTQWIEHLRARLLGFDAMLMPTVAVLAPPLAPLIKDDGLYGRTNALVLRNTSLINFFDGCALSIPCHAPGAGPVGLMIAGPGHSDSHILSVGMAIERVLREPGTETVKPSDTL